MKGYAKPLNEFIEGHKTQFVIPVYQRNYDWLIENCVQLYNDLVKLAQLQIKEHFFGSLVTCSKDSYNRLVIDGQQRITSISLLLLAAIKAVTDGKLAISNYDRIDEAKEVFLQAKYCNSERKIKLLPIENDRIAYDKIFNNESQLDESSTITRNFHYFYHLLTSKPNSITFDQLLDAIESLHIISIELDHDDDAQLIFESLNSTGVALSESDKIRNNMLMDMSNKDQKNYFKNYWQKIEEYTNNEPSNFFKIYLTIKQNLSAHVKSDKLYLAWKQYMEGGNRKEEFKELLYYAKYYRMSVNAKLATEKLSQKMRHICNIGTDVLNVFFVEFFAYADKNALSEDQIFKVIDLIENYLARRIMCNLNSSGIASVFCTLHKEVLKSMQEYTKANMENKYSYCDIATYHLLLREGRNLLPNDHLFTEAIKTRNVHKMSKDAKSFLFERLENAVGGEYNDVASEIKNNEVNVDRIMPDKLSSSWKQMLGDNFDEIKEYYLNTIANLTLIGSKSCHGNKDFEVKKEGYYKGKTFIFGYKDSKYRMALEIARCQQWTEDELKMRMDKMIATLLKLYPMPTTEFKPLSKTVDEYALDEEFSPINRVIKSYYLFGKETLESSWKNMYLDVINQVATKYPDAFYQLFDKDIYFCSNKVNNSQYIEITPGKFVLVNNNNTTRIKALKFLFEQCEIPLNELVFILEKKVEKDNN